MEEQTPEGELLEEDLERLEQLNLHLEAKVRHGLVVKEILKEGRNGRYSHRDLKPFCSSGLLPL